MIYIGIFAIVLVLIVLFVFLKKKQDELEERFQSKYSGSIIEKLDKQVFLAAQESKGYSQSQGLGYLILTDEHLIFDMQLMDNIITIPLSSITNIGQTRRMGGKSTGKTWLKVEYRDNSGRNDALALSVKNLDVWQEKLKSITGRNA